MNNMDTAKRLKTVLIAVSLMGAAFFALLLLPQIRNALISFAEQSILHRQLNAIAAWHMMLTNVSLLGIAVCLAMPPLIVTANRWIPRLRKIPESDAFKIITELQPLFIALFVFIVYMLKNLFLVFGITGFNHIVLLLAIAVHIASVYVIYKNEKTKRELLYSVLICYGIIIISLVLSTLIYDYSYDGLVYHQPGAVKLRDGWNPYKGFLPDDKWMWVNHYPKFTETMGGFFASIAGTIEVHKSYNLIFLGTLFLWTLNFTARHQKNGVIVLLAGAIFCANPVVMAQLFTGYVDGVLGMTIILLAFSLIDFEQTGKLRYLLTAVALSVFAINIKMTGFVSGMVLVAYFIRNLIYKNYKNAFSIMAAGILTLFLGVLFAGYNPYILNIIERGHPFWPLYGENSVDIMQVNIEHSKYLIGKNWGQKFLSLFLIESSIPFDPRQIFHIARSGSYDLRVGGFGVFFIEIFILCLIIGLFSIGKNRTKPYRQVFFSCGLLLALTIVMPGNWWARYICWFWFTPFLFIIPAHISKLKKTFICLCVLCAVNSGAFLGLNIINGVIATRIINRFIREIQESPEQDITVCLYREDFQYSILEKLRQKNVSKNITFIGDEDAVSQYPFTQIKYWEPAR